MQYGTEKEKERIEIHPCVIMLNTAVSRSHSRVAVAVVAAGIAGIAIWRLAKNHHARKAKLDRIAELQRSEKEYREKLRARLVQHSARYRDISELPFQKLVEQLQSGKLKAIDALHAYQYKALLATEKTNCVAAFVRDAERRAMDLDALPNSQPKKPLHGVPVSLKECFLLDGTEATAGLSSLLGKFRDSGTAPVVQFLIDQGCVPFCKTNIPQAILSFDSRNPIYGITKNPHNLSRSPGGSTSGEGVLLAEHGSVLGLGTDIGGSSRIPPAWCGVYSLKPTSQRMISDRGGAEPGSEGTNRVMPPDFGTYSFMARDADTLATVYKLFYSPSTFTANPEMVPVPFRDDIFNSKKPLTIGYFSTVTDCVEAVPAMQRGVRLAKEALERSGHELVQFVPPNTRLALLLEMTALVGDGGFDTGIALVEDVETSYPNQHLVAAEWSDWYRAFQAFWNRHVLGALPTEMLFAMVPCKTPHDLNILWRQIKAYREEVLSAMKAAGIDALLGPAFACPALHLDDPRDAFGAAVYTCMYNVLNWPAGIFTITSVTEADQNAMASYPDIDLYHRVIKNSLTTDSVGLPVAVQIAARPFCEEIVLRAMHDLNGALLNS